MRPPVDLGVRNWAAPGGPINFPLLGLKALIGERFSRIATLIADVYFDITTGGGGGVTGREILEWISMMRFSTKYNTFLPGCNAHQNAILRFNQGMFFAGMFPAAIALGQANDISHVKIVIPFEDWRLAEGANLSEPSERLWDGEFSMTLGAALINANTTVNTCQVSLHAEISHSQSLDAPLYWEDNASAGMLSGFAMPPGLFPDVAIVAPAAAFALADLTNCRIISAGEGVLNANTPDNVVSQFLFDLPITSMGAGLGGTNWTKAFATLIMFPLIWLKSMQGGVLFRDVVDTLGTPLLFDCDGGLTNPVYVYRRYKADPQRSRDDVVRAAGGEPSGMRITTKGLGGAPMSVAQQSRIQGATLIPGKVAGFTSVQAAGRLSNKIPILGSK